MTEISTSQPTLNAVLLLLGSLVLLKFCAVVLGFIYRHFLRPAHNLKKRYGSWALVTGATDGIGRAYAFELARKGLSVILVSRTQSKLDAVAQEIKEKYPGVETKTLAIDFSSFGLGDAQHEKVKAAVKGVDVGLLVNNVGQSYPFPEYYDAIPDQLLDSLIQLNVNSVTWMTRIVLPGMLERKRGAVVNISSIAGVAPSPLLTQYSATKAFVEYHSQSLAAEYERKGIFFQVQSPFFVTTKLAKIKRASLTVPTPQTYARAAVATIGYDRMSVAYWVHDIMAIAVRGLNTFAPKLLGAQTLAMHLGIRKRALRKAEKAKTEKAE